MTRVPESLQASGQQFPLSRLTASPCRYDCGAVTNSGRDTQPSTKRSWVEALVILALVLLAMAALLSS